MLYLLAIHLNTPEPQFILQHLRVNLLELKELMQELHKLLIRVRTLNFHRIIQGDPIYRDVYLLKRKVLLEISLYVLQRRYHL